MHLPTSLTLLVAAGALAGCEPSYPAPAGPAPVDVAGHWTSPCTPSPGGQGAFTMDFHNTASRWQLAYTVFGDAACTAAMAVVDVTGPYEIGGAAPGGAGAHEAIFHFDAKTVTPKVQGAADAFNAMPGCGGGFAVGAAKDVYSTGCPGLGQYPRAACSADYDLVWRADDQLRFGDRPADNNMCSTDKRPHALSPLVLTRIN